VKLKPPHKVLFRFKDKTVENFENKANAELQIINNSKSDILYRVKTTNPFKYMVIPNFGLIKSEDSKSL